ncbi:MAG: asparagine synthase-related protein, partial [Pseudomonadota bacterium]
MSAFFGFITHNSKNSAEYNAATAIAKDVLRSRENGEIHTVQTDTCGLLCATYRVGHFYSDDNFVVALDGYLENLDALAAKHGVETFEGNRPASLIAQIFLKSGLTFLETLEGNHAIVIIDLKQQSATLIRDRFGSHPLLYFELEDGWCWASQLKALLPLIKEKSLDETALHEAIHYRWLVGDRKLLQGVRQVLPTTCVTLTPSAEADIHRYWAMRFETRQDIPATIEAWCDQTDAGLDKYYTLLKQNYNSVAVLLSGGVDSSLLAAKAAQHFDKVVAITPRWTVGENTELEMAQNVARHLGIEHIVVDVDEQYIHDYYPSLVGNVEELPR